MNDFALEESEMAKFIEGVKLKQIKKNKDERGYLLPVHMK